MPKKTGRKDQIRIELKGEMLKKFESLKQYYGAEANTEVIRNLINDKYRDIVKEKHLEM